MEVRKKSGTGPRVPKNKRNPDIFWDVEDIHLVLIKRRVQLGLVQRQVSDLAGIGYNTYRALERGDLGPSIDKLLRAFYALGLTFRIRTLPDGNTTPVPDVQDENGESTPTEQIGNDTSPSGAPAESG